MLTNELPEVQGELGTESPESLIVDFASLDDLRSLGIELSQLPQSYTTGHDGRPVWSLEDLTALGVF